MLDEVKESIINAYEIKTGMSRAKLSHLMDAETWMDANSAVEMGFADEIMQRNTADAVETPQVSNVYSRTAVTNHLMIRLLPSAGSSRNPKPRPMPIPSWNGSI